MAEQVSGMQMYRGLAASDGLVFAPVVRFEAAPKRDTPHYTIDPDRVNAELARFFKAIDVAIKQVSELLKVAQSTTSGTEAAIFESHKMMIEDTFFADTVVKSIRNRLFNAEWAVHLAFEGMAAMMEGMDDDYMRERVADIYDVRDRLLGILDDKGEVRRVISIDRPAIVVADNISPSDAVSLPRRYVRGLATEQGSLTAHVSILARALGVPAVVGIGESLDAIRPGDEVALDGFHGVLWLNPDDATKTALLAETAAQRAAQEHRQRLADQPAITPDGVRVTLLANTDHSVGFDAIGEHGAEGIGLYRTEYLWMGAGREPTEEEQYRAYSEVIRACKGKPATLRVLDIGGDKLVGGHTSEANPFLGNRSVRYLLNNPSTFRAQVRAILRAAVAGTCEMMYPMISSVEELQACNDFVEKCKAELEREGIPFKRDVPTGIMIEIPSAAHQANKLAQHAEFFSIGTNDLVQYMFAVDRGNESVAYLYQPLHPIILETIANVSRVARAHNRSICVCGEMASNPLAAILLVGMGIRKLSMSANLIPRIKELICRIAYFDMQRLVDQLSRRYEKDRLTASDVAEACTELIRKYAPDVISS